MTQGNLVSDTAIKNLRRFSSVARRGKPIGEKNVESADFGMKVAII